MRWLVVVAVIAAGPTARGAIRCDNLSTQQLAIDGLLDDWPRPVLARVGVVSDGAIELRCSWDGTALAIALDIKDDRVVRVRGAGHEDRVDVSIAAGGRPVAIRVYPGTPVARLKIAAPPRVAVADSLQPHGFSIELRVPASQIPGFAPATAGLELKVVFHDADLATGAKDTDIELADTIELGDRKDLLDDFLHTARLRKADVRVDTMAELDPDRRGKERLVAGGTVIGVISDQFAYVSLPAATAADVKRVELIPLGPRGQMVISAVVHQSGNGGSRDLLMLWTVWSGQLQPLAQIEVRKELGASLLEVSWRVVKGAKGPELWVEPRPPVGVTAQTWNEEPAADVDSIVLPWDATRSGFGYALNGHELHRRDLPKKKR
jgi:hypothetical protein